MTQGWGLTTARKRRALQPNRANPRFGGKWAALGDSRRENRGTLAFLGFSLAFLGFWRGAGLAFLGFLATRTLAFLGISGSPTLAFVGFPKRATARGRTVRETDALSNVVVPAKAGTHADAWETFVVLA